MLHFLAITFVIPKIIMDVGTGLMTVRYIYIILLINLNIKLSIVVLSIVRLQVTIVDVEEVLSQGAYMLLYSR